MKRPAGAAPPPRAVVPSSPGRVEKLPTAPGLARLLRGKSGSRSRGRGSVARSSPMFVSRNRSIGPSSSSAAEEGEPSSPKVTCIGQVRIRTRKRKAKSAGSKKTKANKYQQQQQQQQSRPTMRCRCFERALLCKIFARKPTAAAGRPHRPLWRRWMLSLLSWRGSSYQQRKALEREEADLAYPPPVAAARGSVSDLDDGDEEESDEVEEETRVFMLSATATPPKNALLLMRCRSAPHNRSSSLANPRFAVTPLPVASESSPGEEPVRIGGGTQEGEGRPGSCNGGSSDARDGEEAAAAAGPLVLMRCKSEPARRAAAKLVVPEVAASFWNNSRRRRLPLVPEEGPAPPSLPVLPR